MKANNVERPAFYFSMATTGDCLNQMSVFATEIIDSGIFDENAVVEDTELWWAITPNTYSPAGRQNFITKLRRNFALLSAYHFWERQLRWLLSIELTRYLQLGSLLSVDQLGSKELLKTLQIAHIDHNTLRCCQELDSLRLVVNTIKHGLGPASQELYKKRPQYFGKSNKFVSRKLEKAFADLALDLHDKEKFEEIEKLLAKENSVFESGDPESLDVPTDEAKALIGSTVTFFAEIEKATKEAAFSEMFRTAKNF